MRYYDDYDECSELDEMDESMNDDFEDSDDGEKKYEVWLIGFDENDQQTGYDKKIGSFESEDSAIDFIDEFVDFDISSIRDDYHIPDDVMSVEVRGEAFGNSILIETDVFYSVSLDIRGV